MPGGIASTLKPRGDQAERVNLPQADSRPEPGLLEQAGAAMRTTADAVEGLQLERRSTAYSELVDALVERGVERKSLRGGIYGAQFSDILQGGPVDFDRAWQMGKQLGIEGLPDTQEEFEKQAFRRNGGRDADQALLARGTGVDSTLAQFAGGMVGSMADPVNAVTSVMPVGAAKTVAMRILAEAGANAGVEGALALGENPEAYARMGEEYGLGQAVTDIAMAGAAGAVMRGAGEIAPHIDAAGMRALAPARARFDQFFADRDMARALAKLPAEQLTPQQQAARQIFAREIEIEEVSPYARTHGGDDAHRARLQEAGAALAEDRVLPAFNMGRYLDQTRTAESRGSGGDAAAATTSSAYGRYQFLKDTWVEFYRRTFGVTGESRAQVLAKRADGATQDRVMNTFTAANVDQLRRAGVATDEGAAYLAHFLGVKDAIKVLRAPPDTPIGELVTRASIGANRAVFDSIGSASELVAWSRRKMGGKAQGVAARPETGEAGYGLADDPDATARDASLAAEEADLELARINSAHFRTEMVELLKPIVDNKAVSLNRPERIAEALGLEPSHITEALDTLAGAGRITKTRSGIYRRTAEQGPEDMLLFIARKGGISYDGLTQRTREMIDGPRGHDLKNTGNLDHFVPRGGPLLRPNGLALDEIGEQLWEAGYFGPPTTALRPTESEVITAIDDAIFKGEKVYSYADGTPPEPVRGGGRFASPDDENFERTRWSRAAQRNYGRELTDDELFAAMDLERTLDETRLENPNDPEERLDEALWTLRGQAIDDMLQDAYHETEDDFYDAIAATYDWIDPAREGQAAAVRGEGSSLFGGDADPGFGGGEGRPGADRPAALDPATRDALQAGPEGATPNPDNPTFARFDEPDGEGVQAVAESDWHDIKAAPSPTGYKTAKGSSYKIDSEGRTTRDKAPRPEHPGAKERGLQPTSEATYYVREDHLDPLGLMQVQNGGKMQIVRDKGAIAIRNMDGPDAGKIVRGTVTPIETTPALGLIPVELWKDGTRVHFGNKITELEHANPLDHGAATDPNLAARQRDQVQLGAAAPLRGGNATGLEQDGTMGLGLFDAADQPRFDLDDGKGARTAAEIDAEIVADRTGIEAIRQCL